MGDPHARVQALVLPHQEVVFQHVLVHVHQLAHVHEHHNHANSPHNHVSLLHNHVNSLQNHVSLPHNHVNSPHNHASSDQHHVDFPHNHVNSNHAPEPVHVFQQVPEHLSVTKLTELKRRKHFLEDIVTSHIGHTVAASLVTGLPSKVV